MFKINTASHMDWTVFGTRVVSNTSSTTTSFFMAAKLMLAGKNVAR